MTAHFERATSTRSRGSGDELVAALRSVATVRPETTALFELAAGSARDLLDAPTVVVSMVDGGNLLARAVAGHPVVVVGARLPRSRSIAGVALRTGEPVLCRDGYDDERTDAEHNRARSVRSSAVAPLLYRGQPLGCISALSPEPGTFDDDDLRVLAALADVVAARLAYALALDEQAEVEARLDGQQRLLSAVFDALDEGVVLFDLDDRIVTANEAAARIIGEPLDAHLGGVASELPWTYVDGDGAPLPAQTLPVARAMRTGRPQSREVLRLRRDDGHTVALSLRALPVRDPVSEVLTGVVASFRDVTGELEAARDLDAARLRLTAAQQLTGLATWEWDLATGDLVWDDRMFELVGLRPGSVVPTIETFLARVHADDREDCRRLATEAGERGRGYQNVFRVVHDDGQVRHLLAWTDVARDAAGEVVGLRGATVDVTERARATALATRSEERFRIAFDNAPIGMTMISLRPESLGVVLRANAAFCRMLGIETPADRSLHLRDVTHPADAGRDAWHLDRLASGEASQLTFEKRYRRSDGRPVPAWVTTSVTCDDDGTPAYVISHCLDITERLRAQADLERLALTDTLTGLGNRALLRDRLEHALARLDREGGTVALLMLDLDRFKLVNDSLGHQAGDSLLVEVARRLRAVCRTDATIARPGGDEFVVLVEGLEHPALIEPLAERLLESLRAPYRISAAAGEIVTTVSIGVALATGPGRAPEDLHREADLALYRAKDSGRNDWALFDDDLRSRAVRRLDVEQRLRRALDEHRTRLVYQPVVDLGTGTWRGPEALVRIDDPELGELAPGDFIEVAEDTGLIVDIDRRVLRAALGQLAGWAELRDLGIGSVAVNVSARSVEQAGFAEEVIDQLDALGLPGSALHLEVTERTLLEASPTVVAAVTRLTGHGVAIGIDDFGTGYSALAYLQRFPLQFLKIDRSFTSRLGRSDRDDALVAAIVALGQAHELRVVAEGVEEPEQIPLLRAAGCDFAQGYLIGRPMPPEAFAEHVRRGYAAPPAG